MKESDKGLVAVAVFFAIFYLSKKEKSAYVDPVGGGSYLQVGQDARGAGGEVGVYGRGHWRSLHVEEGDVSQIFLSWALSWALQRRETSSQHRGIPLKIPRMRIFDDYGRRQDE